MRKDVRATTNATEVNLKFSVLDQAPLEELDAPVGDKAGLVEDEMLVEDEVLVEDTEVEVVAVVGDVAVAGGVVEITVVDVGVTVDRVDNGSEDASVVEVGVLVEVDELEVGAGGSDDGVDDGLVVDAGDVEVEDEVGASEIGFWGEPWIVN